MLITKGFLGHDYWLAFILLTFPFLPSSVISALNGEILNVFLVPFFYYLFTLLGFIIFERQRKDRVIFDKKQVLIGTGAIVLFLGISGGVMWERSKTVLPPSYGFGYEKGYSSVDLGPYDVTNKKNKLAKLNGSSSLVILYFLSFKLSCRIIGKKDYSC
ncbi:hypothetical protein [Mesobacillus zeae]|nr:hypothetical protein [Mesobacillus zeae]